MNITLQNVHLRFTDRTLVIMLSRHIQSPVTEARINLDGFPLSGSPSTGIDPAKALASCLETIPKDWFPDLTAVDVELTCEMLEPTEILSVFDSLGFTVPSTSTH